jgi:lycopene epsilon-cyclase
MVVALFTLSQLVFREIQCAEGYYLHEVFDNHYFSLNRMWRGFLGSTLSSVDLILFSFYMFAIAPNQLRMNLVRHLLSDPTGSSMIKTYLTL